MADTTAKDQPAPQPEHGGKAVDVQKLAEKVYRLMLEDVRLAAARGGRQPEPNRRRER